MTSGEQHEEDLARAFEAGELDESLAADPEAVSIFQAYQEITPLFKVLRDSSVDQAFPACPPGPVARSQSPPRFGKFEILQGTRGGMGVVFKARDTRLDRLVALKVLPEEYLTTPMRLARFQNEMRALAKLPHANIVTVFEGDVLHGVPFLAMEYLEGADLKRLTKVLAESGRCLPVNDACEIIRLVAIALQSAHDNGLVHRDVKPDNIMLTVRGDVKLLDLGLARSTDEGPDAARLTEGPVQMGTRDYMSPEHWKDARQVGPAGDVYSLGCTLFHALCAKPPFDEFPRERKDHAHLNEPFPSVRALRADVCGDLENVLRRMVEKRPVDRFASAQEVANALKPFCQDADLTKHGDAVREAMQASEPESVLQELDFLRKLGTVRVTSGGAGSPPRVCNVPYLPTPFLTGRAKYLDECRETLTRSGRAALYGLGGIGKTQIALAYTERFRDEYQASLWVNAACRDTLAGGFASLAAELGLPEQHRRDQTEVAAAVKRWLENHDRWLLVLDNAEDLDALREFVPTTTRGHVLLTTQSQAVGPLGARIEILPLTPEEGALLFLRRARIVAERESLENALPEDREAALKVSDEIGGLPLALDQAAAYVEETGISPAAYLERYCECGKRLRADRAGQPARDYPGTVATTWRMAFDAIEEVSSAAAELLQFCAFLAPGAIPEDLIGTAAGVIGGQLAAADSVAMDAVFRTLGRYSLVKRDTRSKVFYIHRLVQAVQRDSMTEAKSLRWIEYAAHAVCCYFRDVPDTITWRTCDELLPHLLSVITLWPDGDGGDRLPLAILWACVGRHYLGRSLYKTAGQALTVAVETMQDVIGKRMRDSCMPERVVECTGLYIEALTDLATALGVEDTNHPLIDKCYEWAFDLTRALDPQSEMHAGVCLAIASLHEKRGRYADAKRICQSVLEELKPESYKLRAQALAGLALAELGCGNDAEAEQLLKQASQFRSHCEGASPGLPEILVYLAAIKFRRTEYSAAESLIRESLEIRRKVVGTDPHFWVGQTLGVLAHTCVKLGRHDEAEQYFVEAVSMVRETVGVGHEQYKSYALDLLRCYIVQGKQDAAESFARHLLQEVAADDAIRADVQEMLKRRPDLPSAGNSGSKFSSTSGFTEDSDLHGATLLPRSNKAGRNPSRHRRIGRNDPCPCGSGKKFKRCCGRPTSDDTRIGP